MSKKLAKGSAAELARDIRNAAGSGKIAFVSGNFNVLHPGHLRLLRFAAEVGDHLVVGVLPDSNPGVTIPQGMRLESVLALSLVDTVVPLDGTVVEVITALKPDFVVKGTEFEPRQNVEEPLVAAYGGRLLFSSGEAQFASYQLIEKEFTSTNFSSIRKSADFPQRHGFDVSGLVKDLDKVSGMRVMVIGDLIVDDYITCDAIGMSQEDPTIVVTPIETKTFVGGAGVVAAHANGLGADVQYITVVGRDETAEFARRTLESSNVRINFIPDDTRPTTRKQRFRASGKTLLRVNHLRQHPIGLQTVRNIIRHVDEQLDKIDLLLFSDFNYGLLPQALVDAIANRAYERGVMMAADSQASSQMSDISRFKRMNLITPTEREARMALRDTQSGLPVVASKLVQACQAEAVLVTLGAEGMLIHAKKDGEYLTDRLPAFNTAPKDVAGAGDSLFTATSLALCAGTDFWKAIYIGAVAAACQVGRVGNAPLSRADIAHELSFPMSDDRAIA